MTVHFGKKDKQKPQNFFVKFALEVDKTNFSLFGKLGLARAMMEMRVMMQGLKFIYEKSHRFNILRTSQKLLQAASAKILFSAANEHEKTRIIFKVSESK